MIDYLKKQINNQIAFLKLEVVDVVSNMIGTGIFAVIAGVCSLMVLFIGSIAIGFLLGGWLEDRGTGFLIVTGFYVVLLTVFLIFRKKIMLLFTNPLIRAGIDVMDNSENKTP